eukprot:7230528-Prymnesium_polylepis.1
MLAAAVALAVALSPQPTLPRVLQSTPGHTATPHHCALQTEPVGHGRAGVPEMKADTKTAGLLGAAIKWNAAPSAPIWPAPPGALDRERRKAKERADASFGHESVLPGREAEYEAFKAQGGAESAAGPAYEPPAIDDERRSRSPGLRNNFYDVSQADFKRPHGMG